MSQTTLAASLAFAAALALAPAAAEAGKTRVLYPGARAYVAYPAPRPLPRVASVSVHKLPDHTRVVVELRVRPGYRGSRAYHRQRALFRTWTGFVDQYSGPRYPF